MRHLLTGHFSFVTRISFPAEPLRRKQYVQRKEAVFRLHRRAATLSFGNIADAFQPVAMIIPVALGGHGQSVLEDQFRGIIVPVNGQVPGDEKNVPENTRP